MDRMSGGSWWDTASHQTVGVIRCLHGYLCASVLEGTCRFDTSMVDAVVVGVDARFDVSFFFGGQLVPTPPTTLKDNGCQNNNRRTQPGVHTVVTPPLTPSAQSTQSAQPTYSAHSAPPPELHHTNGKTNTKEPRVFHSTTTICLVYRLRTCTNKLKLNRRCEFVSKDTLRWLVLCGGWVSQEGEL